MNELAPQDVLLQAFGRGELHANLGDYSIRLTGESAEHLKGIQSDDTVTWEDAPEPEPGIFRATKRFLAVGRR